MRSLPADPAEVRTVGFDRPGEPLGAEFYGRPAQEVARDLLGRVLFSTVGGHVTAARIVETEAYTGPDDPASHAAARIGRTARNASMFSAGGHAYVYLIYGVHWCLNMVTGPAGFPSAVLVRAVEPMLGVEVMRRRRGAGARSGQPGDGPLDGRRLTGGPARLAEALGVTGELDGHPLDQEPLELLDVPGWRPPPDITVGPRIGVTRARERPLRYHVTGNRWVSR